jgi:YD repeat-containing protein
MNLSHRVVRSLLASMQRTHRQSIMNTSSRLAALAAALTLAIPAQSAIIAYTYDGAGRVTGVNYGGASNTAYAYDNNGNLLSRVNSENKFIPLLGKYAGLVTGGTPTAQNSGIIALTVASNGAFTGTLKLGGVTYKLRGTFDENGFVMLDIPRKAPLIALTLTLQLDLDSNGQITGTISGGEIATLSAALTPFGKKAPPPSGLIGAYTALFEPTQPGITIPQGDGFATVNVSKTGSIKLVGALADGSKISLGTVLAGDGTWPLFAGLYRNAGFVTGTVTFGTEPGVSDFSATLDWLKPATTGPIYPAAFTTELDLLGSHYVRPAKGHRVIELANESPNARVTASGGNSAAIDKFVTLDIRNKIVVAAPGADALKLSVSTAAGLLKGSFIAGKPRKLQGVIFQEQNRGAGFFLGTSESGVFELNAEP